MGELDGPILRPGAAERRTRGDFGAAGFGRFTSEDSVGGA